MEKVQTRVQEAIDQMINTLDRDHLRKMQAQVFHCSANCCEKADLNMQEVQNCVERCSDSRNKCQEYLQTEMTNFQNRLQRCALDCQDRARDGLMPSSNESELARLRSQMESCVLHCADDHVALVPSMLLRAKEVIKSHAVQ